MANSKQAKKRDKQSERRRLGNQPLRTKLRTFIKNTLKAIASGNKSAAQDALNAAVPVIDNSVDKGIIHKNKAARHKSRMNAQVKAL